MRTLTETIFCDSCNKDISPTSSAYPHNWILEVSVKDVAKHGGAVYALIMYPPLENNLYFCGVKCMTKYEL